MWILGSFKKDALFFYLPGGLGILLALAFPHLGESSLWYAFIATGLIDSGHVYTTFWRTLFHPEEFRSRKAYFILPLCFFFIFTVWFKLGAQYLWSFVVYATLFHHVRQVYGVSKWYQVLNKKSDGISDKFLYLLAIFPMFAYHFRPGVPANYYSLQDLFLNPNAPLFQDLMIIYGLIITGWVVREIAVWRSGRHEINRLLSVAIPGLVYAHSFLYAKTLSQVLFPLLFIHGITYFGIMGQSLHRTRKKLFKSGSIALGVVLLTSILLGSLESWMEENVITMHEKDVFSAVIIGLWLTPLFCHYAFDAWIWKKSHRESALVVGTKVH